MDDKLREMVRALSRTMPPTAAEICVRGAALMVRKPVERLTAEDLPALERSVRATLRGTTSDASIELTIVGLREVFLRSVDAADC